MNVQSGADMPGVRADGDRAAAADLAGAAEAAEAARQRALVGALFAAPGADAPDAAADADGAAGAAVAAPGLRAYRANAYASAERALAQACPGLRVLLGAEDFAHLAREFWHAHPPQRGDLGEWGDALPAWLEAHAGLRDWPYLADCARLDLAVRRCERAADATLDAASLALLQDQPPATLRLRLRPGVQCVVSARWPIETVPAAQAAGTAEAGEALCKRARARIAAGEGEAALVARDGWRASVRAIGAPTAAFMQVVARDLSLAHALTAAGDDFDFAAWLADALRCQWLLRVEPWRG